VTRTGMMIGSMGFMAPEQISGHPGPEADIFAWGVTVAYAATGRSPFGGGSTHSILYRIMYGDPDIATVPDPLLPLVEAALIKEPQSRPTARQLLDRLTSASSQPGKADDTTQVILARTWQTGSRPRPAPDGLPAEAAATGPPRQPVPPRQSVPPRQHLSPSAWPSAAAPATAPPAEPPAAERPTTDAPVPALPFPAAQPAETPAPAPAKQPVSRRMATIATSAMVALRLRRPHRDEPDHPGHQG
jgi:serine/threonine protein kinase